jgi:hypothetical protein
MSHVAEESYIKAYISNKISIEKFLSVNLKIEYSISHLSPEYEEGRRDVKFLVILTISLNPAGDDAAMDTCIFQPKSNEVKFTDVEFCYMINLQTV